MRDKYFIPWKDESSEHTRKALEYLAFELSQHTDGSYASYKERLYRWVGWQVSLDRGRKAADERN